MSFPRSLPDDSVLLRERDFEKLSLREIADRYGVTTSAVSHQFIKMGRSTIGNAAMEYWDFIPWKIQQGHKALDAAIRLRAHVRRQSGMELTESAARRLDNWWTRLRRDGTVLTYLPESAPSPWHYVPREPSDGSLIIRWPEDMPPPTEAQRTVLTLPDLQ